MTELSDSRCFWILCPDWTGSPEWDNKASQSSDPPNGCGAGFPPSPWPSPPPIAGTSWLNKQANCSEWSHCSWAAATKPEDVNSASSRDYEERFSVYLSSPFKKSSNVVDYLKFSTLWITHFNWITYWHSICLGDETRWGSFFVWLPLVYVCCKAVQSFIFCFFSLSVKKNYVDSFSVRHS